MIFFLIFIYLFIYFWLCRVFVFVWGLSLVAASGGHSSSRCVGLSLSRPLLLQSTGSRRAGSVVMAHGPSCSAACGIFPDQGWNPCPLNWQADSQPLRHQGSPVLMIFNNPSLFLTFGQGLLRTSFPQMGHSELLFLHVSAKPKYGGKYCQQILEVDFFFFYFYSIFNLKKLSLFHFWHFPQTWI